MHTFRGKGSIWVILQKYVHYYALMSGYQLSFPFISCYDLFGDLLEIEKRYGYTKMSFRMQVISISKVITLYIYLYKFAFCFQPCFGTPYVYISKSKS